MENRFDRRRFLRLAVGSVLVLPAGRFLVACMADDGSGSTGNPVTPGGGSNPPAAAPQVQGSQIVYTTSNTGSHFHTFALDEAALSSPPAAGVNGQTSVAAQHSHSVSVSMAELASVEGGGTVQVTTGAEGGHTHVLTLVKLAANAPDAAPGGGGGGGGAGGGSGGGGGYPYPGPY